MNSLLILNNVLKTIKIKNKRELIARKVVDKVGWK